MDNLTPVLDQFRIYGSQILAMIFDNWPFMIPIAMMSVDEIGKLLKRIKQ